jgi:hypothetical protein
MMKKSNTIYKAIFTVALLFIFQMCFAQQEVKKVTFNGAARAQFYGDHYKLNAAEEDTITNTKLNSGNTLVDLGINIRPHSNMEIQGLVRIRNDYGGFWGAGVSFDVRQLYVKGVAGGIVRYQLGDINYKLTKYTLWNNNQEIISNTPAILQQQTDVVNYDHFYSNDNSWRQQGASAEMGLVFSKYIQELNFYGVATRVKTSDFGQTNDRIFSGLSVQMLQSKYASLGWTATNTFDIEGTSRQKATFHQPVMTMNANFKIPYSSFQNAIDIEAGKSGWFYNNLDAAPNLKGQFVDAELLSQHKATGLFGSIQLKYISSDFRSTGAQTKRTNYSAVPVAYQRITNSQDLRQITMLDLMRESSLYNTQLQTKLMAFSPQYDNITPYGDATPNRKATVIKVGYKKAGAPLKIETLLYSGSEVKGEGTKTFRTFRRSETKAQLDLNEYRNDTTKVAQVTISFRNDKTSRAGTEAIPTVDLKTRVWSIGTDYEWSKNWHVLAGMQMINYNGFDFKNVRDQYGTIYNFEEMKTDGEEKMWALGIKHTFSARSFLSVQYYNFELKQNTTNGQNYNFGQWMLLYQIKF